jgi:hypothetical protein
MDAKVPRPFDQGRPHCAPPNSSTQHSRSHAACHRCSFQTVATANNDWPEKVPCLDSINFNQAAGNRPRTVTRDVHNGRMRKGDVICPECNAGFRRIELASRPGTAGEFRCPLCDHILETFDGSTEIAYRLTVAPEKLFE